MPNKKVLVILIICAGLVVSSWLISKEKAILFDIKKPDSISIVENSENLAKNDDWKKMLTTVDTVGNIVTDLTANSQSAIEDTTLTAQISRDFMSEFIRLKGSGQEITQADIDNLTQKVLNTSDYTTTEGAVYNELNIQIVDANKENLVIYRNSVSASIKKGLAQIQEDPSFIVTRALSSENKKELAKLDPIINANKTIIIEFLNINVPKNAVSIHLALLNSFSSILADLEAMRVVFEDPIRSFSAINRYDGDKSNFITALNALSQFLVKI